MLLALAIAFSGSSSRSTPSSSSSTTAPRATEITSPAPSLRCRSARLAVSYYRALTYERQDAREGRNATRSPIVRGKACRWARYASEVWRARARAAAAALEEWIYLYAWEQWLPANWRALAVCETGLNFAHTNADFTSAFGISWAEYDRDAAYNGAPPWKIRHTPRDQYLAALGHYARFGDGWSCAGP